MDNSGMAPAIRLPEGLLPGKDVAGILARIKGQSGAEIYRTQHNVRAVTEYRAAQIAQLGLHVFKHDDDAGRKRDRDSLVAAVVGAPSLAQSTFDWVFGMVMDLALYDETIMMVAPSDRTDHGWEVRPIPVESIVERRGSQWAGTLSMVAVADDGSEIKIPSESLFHIHGWAPSYGAAGVSPIDALRSTISEQAAAAAYRESVWRNGGLISSFISRPKDAPKWSQEAHNRFTAGMQKFRQGGSRQGGMPVLEDGMEIKTHVVQAKEQQWLEAAEQSLESVCRAYRIPPAMVGATGGVTYANMREFRRLLYGEALGPTIRQIEAALNRRLLPMLGAEEGTFVEMNLEEKLRGSFEEQGEVMYKAVGGPWMTVNEARRIRNLPTVEGGDVLLQPLNMGGVGADGAAAEDPPAVEASKQAEIESKSRRVFELTTTTAHAPDLGPHETAVRALLQRTIDRQRQVVLSELGGKSHEVKSPRWDGPRWNRELTEDLAVLAANIADEIGEAAAAELGYPEGYDTERTRAFLLAVASSRAERINEGTRQALEAALAAGQDVGHVFDVARDSTALAWSTGIAAGLSSWAMVEAAGQITGRKPLSRATKTWLVRSGNPRATHAAMSGQTVAIDERFSNGADWPGDSALGADEVAGCQCGVEITVQEVSGV